RAGAKVTLLDMSDRPGGQYHRGADASRWRRILDHANCTWWPESSVWALEQVDPERPPHVHIVRGPADGAERPRIVLAPDALVRATGAHEGVRPFPGGDLPGVFPAGAAQALAKGDGVAVGRRVLVSGTGPFLLPVAASLADVGARVLAVLEANSPRTVL